jgi:hypothetical protein
MKSGPTPAFVLARVCAPAAQAWLPVSGSSTAWPPFGLAVVARLRGKGRRSRLAWGRCSGPAGSAAGGRGQPVQVLRWWARQFW